MARAVRLHAGRAAEPERAAAEDPRRRSGGIRREHGAGDPGSGGTARRVPGAAARWPHPLDRAIGRVEFDARGRPVRSRGACIDITSRKQAEQEMLRLRQDIAHVGRVSVMGQLASALAHEINQPLGAILRNAEAAALFMQDPSPDLAEITAILEDIRKDDQRAGAVIDRMRALLRRQEVEMKPLDVPQMLDDVAALLRPDAAARHIALEIDVAAGPSAAARRPGAAAAGAAQPHPQRHGCHRRRGRRPPQGRGDGTPPGSQHAWSSALPTPAPASRQRQIDRVFDPFFTTKTTGSAWGCRSRAASSRPTAAASGRRTTPRAGRPSASRCRSPTPPDGHSNAAWRAVTCSNAGRYPSPGAVADGFPEPA